MPASCRRDDGDGGEGSGRRKISALICLTVKMLRIYCNGGGGGGSRQQQCGGVSATWVTSVSSRAVELHARE